MDVSDTANDAGIECPVALTAEVWEKLVGRPSDFGKGDEEELARDVLWMLRRAIWKEKAFSDQFEFSAYVQDGTATPSPVNLRASLSCDDKGRPCFTVMLA